MTCARVAASNSRTSNRSPRALARFGEMIRQKGLSGDTRVLSEDWIDASFVARTRSPWSGLSYGYGWFLTRSGYVLGRGYGGQVIAAHRERGLVVAITSDPTRPARSGGYFGDLMNLLEGPILALA